MINILKKLTRTPPLLQTSYYVFQRIIGGNCKRSITLHLRYVMYHNMCVITILSVRNVLIFVAFAAVAPDAGVIAVCI